MAKSLEELSPLIHEILRNAESSYPDAGHRIWEVWEAAVGADLARRSQPVTLRRGQLVVAVSSSSWMQQLSFLRDSIRDAVNRALGVEAVRTIRLQVSAAPAPSSHHRRMERPAWLTLELDAATLQAVEEELSTIEDPSLRDAVRRARKRAEQVRRFKGDRGGPRPPESTDPRARGGRGEA